MSDRRASTSRPPSPTRTTRPASTPCTRSSAADVIARWHRMLGDDTRFLTGTDEHSRQHRAAAAARGPDAARRSSTRRSSCSGRPRTRCSSAPTASSGRPTPTTTASAQEMVRRAYANGDIYLGTYEGWYCPNEGFKAPSRPASRPRAGMHCPNHPERGAPVADRAQLVLPPVGLPGAPAALLRGATRTSSSPTTAATRCWASSARASRTSPSAARAPTGASRSRSREDGETAQREDGSWDPEAGTIYVWYDALINYITGAGFPDDLEAFAALVAGRPARHRQGHHPLPHDLLAGDAVGGGHRRCRARSGSTAGCSPRASG